MKAVILVLGAAMLIIFAPAILDSVGDFRTNEQTAAYDVTTGAGATTANITVTEPVYNGATANIAVSSNDTDDAPIPSIYTSASKKITITGLAESTTRRLTFVYKISGLDDYIGAEVGAAALPLMLIIGIMGIIGGAIYTSTQRGD